MINTTVLKKQDYAKWSIFNSNLEVEAFIESLIWRKIVSAQSFEDSKNLPGFVSNSFLHGVKWGQSEAFFGKIKKKSQVQRSLLRATFIFKGHYILGSYRFKWYLQW